jgi:inner membrane protein
MDPLTHALAGATIAHLVAGERLGRRALLIGAVAALAPDLDVLIRSDTDPLLAIEHHRGFTHSLAFVPVGASVVALLFWKWPRRYVFLASLLAYATHPLLDAMTTYGTQLFWPFSRMRTGLDIISIIDPLFTLIWIVAFAAAYAARRRVVAAAAVAAAVWLAVGAIQHARASDAQKRLAASRGEPRDRGEVFPAATGRTMWRSIYQTRYELRIDRIRAGWFEDPEYAETTTVPIATSDPLASARAKRDFARFAWFSNGWIARDPREPAVIADARYSLRASDWSPVWGVRIDDSETEWIDRTRERSRDWTRVWRELSASDLSFHPIPSSAPGR